MAGFEGNGRVRVVTTANGLRLDCDFVVLGLGVEPVTNFLDDRIGVDDGVLVDEYCRSNVDGVFAAGDVARHFHPVFGERICTEHWNNARRQGRAAALNMLGRTTPYDEVPWFWSDQYEHTIEYAGYHQGWDDLGDPREPGVAELRRVLSHGRQGPGGRFGRPSLRRPRLDGADPGRRSRLLGGSGTRDVELASLGCEREARRGNAGDRTAGRLGETG